MKHMTPDDVAARLSKTLRPEVAEAMDRVMNMIDPGCGGAPHHRAKALEIISDVFDPLYARATAAEERARVLEEALTASADTKAAYHGEFSIEIEYTDDDGEQHTYSKNIPWDTVKQVMAAILARANAGTALSREGEKAKEDRT